MMRMKWLKLPLGIAIALAMILAWLPVTTAHAGFVTNEEPTQSTISYGQGGGYSSLMSTGSSSTGTFHHKSVFPMVGRWIIYPGRAFKLQFFYETNGCYCPEKHLCMDSSGDTCFP